MNDSKSPKDAPWVDADEIKRRVSIEQVLESYGLLENMHRKGSRLTGCSPFREDETPSFSANLERNIWNDFGGKPDGVPGNVVGLVQMIENCSFREALVILHRRFIGETLESPSPSTHPGAAERSDDRATHSAGAVDRRAAASAPKTEIRENVPFGRELKGRADIPMLRDKGLTEETVKAFGVVYCSAGMMKGRVAFPIRNVKGEIVAYAGRAVKPADERDNGKYRFPPKFEKSLELFNIDKVAGDAETKKAVKDFGLIVVEGFTDAMKLWQEGFKNVVALMGTDFHAAQKRMLLDPKLNPTRRITLFLDNDEAGHMGKRKIAADLIHNGFVRYTDWSGAPEGKTEPEQFCRDELIQLLGHKQ